MIVGCWVLIACLKFEKRVGKLVGNRRLRRSGEALASAEP
jgi:hypothetical protein